VEVLKKQLAEHGFDPNRLHLGFLSGDDGVGFANAMREFIKVIKLAETSAI
jgi:coenzyme F420-reducing hydrogenase delta subunit